MNMLRAWRDGEKRPYLGVVTEEADDALRAQLGLPAGVGLIVEHVEPDSPAAAAGIKRFDILHKLDEQVLVNPEQLRTLIHSRKKDDVLKLAVIRAGKAQELSATLGEQSPQLPPWMAHLASPNMERVNQLIDEMREKLKAGGAKATDETAELLEKLAKELRERRQGWFGPPGSEGRPPGGPRDGFRPPPREGEAPPPRDGEGRRPGPRDGGGSGRLEQEGHVSGATTASAAASYSDDEHRITLTMNSERGRHLTVLDKSGEVVFEGVINTEEERAKVPESVRPKLERLMRQTRIETRVHGDHPGRGGDEGRRPPRQPD